MTEQSSAFFIRLRPTGARRIFVLLSGLGTAAPRMHSAWIALVTKHINEEVFLDAEFRVAAFEIAGAVILDAMPQYQVLSASRRANRISLHEAEAVESAFQRRGGRDSARRPCGAGRRE